MNKHFTRLFCWCSFKHILFKKLKPKKSTSYIEDDAKEYPIKFSLKNDKEEAIVRIMEDSVENFELLTTHPINVDGKFRTVSCIRTPQEPIDNCPFCKNNTKIQSKIFIKMI